uniref:FAD-binding PCMH-type domain-containing protein n=1 Tax=Kalanchoe fedtschenkoi TaxID=63787 RepID=A0A7N0REN0_KALFE
MSRIFFFIIFLLSTLISSAPSRFQSYYLRRFSSCLALNKVTNFTALPQNHNTSAEYYALLKYSIYNLRFADQALPKPLFIVLPGTADQISKTVGCAKAAALRVRARCGGHDYEGASSVSLLSSPFIIIDLMNLDKVEVDLRSETAWVEGGATLGQTYKAIADASSVHAFTGGSCPTVGVGGHISGGGFGLLSRKYGLAADNVVDAILVDANGRLLNRSAMGEDVFWALRGGGGGGGWGIICAWKIKLQPVPQTVTSFVVSRQGTQRNLTNLVDTWQSVAPKLPDEFYLSVFIGSGCPAGVCVSFDGFYLGSKSEAVSVMTRLFPGLGVTPSDCMESSWIESVLFFSGLGKNSSLADLSNRYSTSKHFFKAKSDYVKSPIPLSGIRSAMSMIEAEPKGYVILDPYGGAMGRIPRDTIAFPHRSGNLFSIQYQVEWKAEDDQRRDSYIKWIREFYDVMEGFVSSSPRAAYVNYLDFDLGVTTDEKGAVEKARVWGERYFLGNFDRLVRAKTEIDPENYFRSEQGIPPLLSRPALH